MMNLTELNEKFNKFKAHDMQTYTPTGATPAKRIYSIQRNLSGVVATASSDDTSENGISQTTDTEIGGGLLR